MPADVSGLEADRWQESDLLEEEILKQKDQFDQEEPYDDIVPLSFAYHELALGTSFPFLNRNESRLERAYARALKILLELQRSRRVVQFGIVRIHLQYCSEEVQAAIVSAKTPLGRILIDHDVLRRIQPTDFLRVMPGPKFLGYFGLTEPRTMYGRLALIHCDEKPAIELLEIVAPE